ncbi:MULTISPECIES: ABC transporter permease subunit [Halobacterium]|uniref:ABC transporter permease n=1 Tax=Halobacterium TaxID=2239 RepID=UPI001E2E88FF|nr:MULTISPECIES: ABC transporter permease subunit [Halobacterium]MDL0123461.1 ABC transporter permease subunit [Halobacterium salinarum]MDL0128552.1 ABC transporter permease subunit [Halobacterium salinarum]MDL0133302.1 ABC transporter permease subunit [Halobacterium salinarum]QRY25873.2 ABC transporter permease [Halobacterium sp. BOL4-2]
MPTTTIARTQCRQHLRRKSPWLAALAFLVLSRIATRPDPEAARIIGNAISLVNAQSATTFTVPFAAAALGFRSIIGERESGTARILLSTRTTRPRLILGMVLGRGTALLVPILTATVLVVGHDILRYGQFSPLLFLAFLALSTVYVFAWTGLTIGLSAVTSSTTRAAILGTTVTLGFVLWKGLTLPTLWQFTTGFVPGRELAHPEAFEVARWLSPTHAFVVLTNWLFGVPIGPDVAVTGVADALRQSAVFAPTPPPVSWWWALGFLLAWPALALAGGITIFQRGDLAPRSRAGPFRRLIDAASFLPQAGGRQFNRLPEWSRAADSLPGSWQPLARREFRRLARSPIVWLVGGLVFVGAFLSLPQPTHVQDALGSRVPLAALQTPLYLIGGFGVLFGTFRAVIRERDTGTIRSTAGTAISRTETLVGFTLGRAAAFAVPLVLAAAFTCFAAVPRYGVVPLDTLAVFLAYTLLFLVVIAAIGVSLSTIFRSQTAAGFVILAYAFVHITWFQISNTLYGALSGTAVSGFSPPTNPLYLVARWLPPLRLPFVVTNAIIGVPNSAGPATSVLGDLQPNVFSNLIVVRLQYGADVPVWYLHPFVALIAVLLWALVPFAVAVALHRRRNIE